MKGLKIVDVLIKLKNFGPKGIFAPDKFLSSGKFSAPNNFWFLKTVWYKILWGRKNCRVTKNE